jgi:hypothetical protein
MLIVQRSNTFIAPCTLADAGNLPLSSIYGNNEAYNIPCGSIHWQSFVYARADTSTDTDVFASTTPYNRGVGLQDVGNAKFE